MASSGGRHVRAEQLRDLQAGERDAAADAPDQHVLAGCRRARVTSMRHAVSVASVNAAASAAIVSGATRRTFTAGTTTNSASVPGRCSPRMP